MWTCERCDRHVLPGAPACPFCAGSKLAALSLAALAPAVLGACYGLPPCDDNDLQDADGDGWSISIGSCNHSEQEDCDDTDPNIHPEAEEICDDDIDNNCDGFLASVDASELCDNGIDDDCDGEVDEPECGTPYETGLTTDTDTTDDGLGAVTLALSWTSGATVTTCAEAGVVTLDVTIDDAGTGTVAAVSYDCSDTGILVSDIPAGSAAIQVQGASTDGIRTWTSGPVLADVLAQQTITVPVELTCSSPALAGCD